MRKEKAQSLKIKILTILTITLVLFMAFILFLIPLYQQNIAQKQVQAYNQGIIDASSQIIITVNQQGFIQVPLEEGQSLTLVPYVDPNVA